MTANTSKYGKIPMEMEWLKYQNSQGRFITYWGDIYTGTLYECPGYDNGFFIVPNYYIREIQQLGVHERTPDKYRELGWEIKDHRVIIHKYSGDISWFQDEFKSDHGPIISKSDQQFRDMFIFGAGASANCCFDDHNERYKNDPWKAPMGYDIFNENYDEICQKYLGAQLAIPNFEIKNNTIEACLEDDWKQYSQSYLPELTVRHINIQFYLKELFQEISQHTTTNYYRKNLYQVFALTLQKYCGSNSQYRPLIVNFNYDTILDTFIDRTFRYNTKKLSDYIDWDNRSVIQFKPHGSCNWGWKFSPKKLEEHRYSPLSDLIRILYHNKVTPAELCYNWLGEYPAMVNGASFGMDYSQNGLRLGKHSLDKLKIDIVSSEEPAYPALLLPFKEKDEFVMPYYHQTAMEFTMQETERLFVIGWKGSEELFLKQLKKANRIKEVIIVNPELEEVKANLINHVPEGVEWKHVNNFETFIKENIGEYLS